jgi:DNA-3-methyladenine glycosylase I
MMKYHDTEWGVPLHDDPKLFEFLVLESFQAGLSWQIVLNKREAFRKAFDEFDPEKIARYNEQKLNALVQDKSIIRNKQKIVSCINNVQRFLEVQKEFGSFDKYIWGFVDYKPVVNTFASLKELPAKTPLSDKISADLKRRGFKFIGSTVVYAHMQATGMVNDHLVSCFRYNEVNHI